MLQQQQRSYGAASEHQQQQQQRRYHPAQNNRVKVGQRTSISSSNGQQNDLMSESTCDRRTQLGQSFYQDAKKTVGEALTCDESGSNMAALELYNKALCSIRSGLAVLRSSVGAVPVPDSALQDLKAKMERLKEQIKARMEDLLQLEVESRHARCKDTLMSSQTSAGRRTQCSPPHEGGMSRSKEEAGPSTEDKAAADLMFHMDTGIGLFEVDKNDHVMRFDDVDAVSVFRYQHHIEGQPPAFLQCGGFIYPLVPGQSPVLKSGDKIYMFPDLRKEDGSSVGISLETASSADLAHLDQLLTQLANLKTTAEVTKMARKSSRREEGEMGVTAGSKAEPTWGTTMAGGIDKGVNWVSTKIAKGTEMAGNLVIKGASKLRERIEPEEKPAEIPVAVQKGVHYTRQATGCVVSVSDFLMSSLAKLTVRAGMGVKNMIQESEMVKGQEVNPHAMEAWKVTKSGVKGAAGVFTDLKAAASAVVRTAGKESSRTVGHKYGPDAEKVADDALVATGNTVSVAATYWSWKTWGITFLGKIGEVISRENGEKEEKNGEKSENSDSQPTVKSS